MEPTFDLFAQSGIYIGPAGELLPGLLPSGRVVAVIDPNVARHWSALAERFDTVLVGTGERSKTLRSVERIYRRFIELGVDRSTFVLAVGGGIVTDMAGFAAATYMRGLRFGFVSTTLLGQVDASVGGKNGVNIDGYKNMAGTFAQPEFVVCDPALLRTLSDRDFRAGLAEAVKAAVIADADLFARIEGATFARLRGDDDLLSDVISASIRVKADIVSHDERERGERRKLNLGHTLAHAIEKCTPAMNHGEAVAVGMALIADAAVAAGCSLRPTATGSSRCSVRWGSISSRPWSSTGCCSRCRRTRKARTACCTSSCLSVSATARCVRIRRPSSPRCSGGRTLRCLLRMAKHPAGNNSGGVLFNIYGSLLHPAQPFGVGIPVVDGLSGDARGDCGAGYGRGDRAQQARVERLKG